MPPPPSPKKLRVLVCSGNLGNAQPDIKSLEAWIPMNGDCQEVLVENPKYPLSSTGSNSATAAATHKNNTPVAAAAKSGEKFDLIVIGMQEATFDPTNTNKNSPASPQSTTGNKAEEAPNNNKSIHDFARQAVSNSTAGKLSRTISTFTVNKNHTEEQPPTDSHNLSAAARKRKEWMPDGTAVLHHQLQQRLPSYTRLLSFQRGQMRLLIYSANSNAAQLKVVSVQAQNTGKGGLANKGGILATLQTSDGATTLTFLTCHLEAHEGLDKYERRCNSLAEILGGTCPTSSMSSSQTPDASLQSHVCFVLGDLNFRTRYQGHIFCTDQREDVVQLVKSRNWDELNQADELKKALANDECLVGFETLDCPFPPTFKMERSAGHIYKDNRTPSYTDRILWKSGTATPLVYEPIDDYVSSDHKPMRGAFDIPLNSPVTLLPKPNHHHNQHTSNHHDPNQHRSRYAAAKSSILKRIPGTHSHRVLEEENENLHLFLSDMKCDIFPPRGTTNKAAKPPDTYVCLMSSPGPLLQSTPPIWRQCLRALFHPTFTCRPSNSTTANPHHKTKTHNTKRWWPHSPVTSGTFNPDWGDYEIHGQVHAQVDAPFDSSSSSTTTVATTTTSTLLPTQLGGAILYIVVLQQFTSKSGRRHGGEEDAILGSFPIDLEYLFRVCAAHRISAAASGKGKDSAVTAADKKKRTMRLSSSSSITLHESTTNSRMCSLDIDGPLLKDGRQTGVLRCSLDVWWVADSLAYAARSHSLEHGLSTNDTHHGEQKRGRWWSGAKE